MIRIHTRSGTVFSTLDILNANGKLRFIDNDTQAVIHLNFWNVERISIALPKVDA